MKQPRNKSYSCEDVQVLLGLRQKVVASTLVILEPVVCFVFDFSDTKRCRAVLFSPKLTVCLFPIGVFKAKKKHYDLELENLEKHQKQTIEKMEADHSVKLKDETKRIKSEQERELHKFQDQIKHKKKEVRLKPVRLSQDVEKGMKIWQRKLSAFTYVLSYLSSVSNS